MKPPIKRTGTVVASLKTAKGKWEIYKTGKQFGNRLLARNGNIICANFGFNTKASAWKNIRAVQKTAI